MILTLLENYSGDTELSSGKANLVSPTNMKIPGGGVPSIFSTEESVPIFEIPNLTLNHYSESVSNNEGINSTFGVYESEERKNCGICYSLQ